MAKSGSVVYPDGFYDRVASELTIVRWVARNMESVEIDLDDCPDPIAWNMLANYVNGSGSKDDFWRNIYSKVLTSRMKDQQEDDTSYEGEEIVDVIAKIEEFLAND